MTERKTGRPASDEARKVQTFVSFTPRERTVLEKMAAREGRSLSQQIRFIVRERLTETRVSHLG